MWSEEDRGDAENTLFGCGEGNPLSSQGPISEVHVVGSKHFVYKRLFFFFFSLGPSLRDGEPWSGSTAAPQQSGCGYTAQTSGPFDITLRNHEVRGRLFLLRHKGVIFHSPRENSGE